MRAASNKKPCVIRARTALPLSACRCNLCDCLRQLLHDLRRLDAQDSIASTCELAITARVRAGAACVIAAIDLDDETKTWRVEVSNESEQRNLTPKGDPELTRAQSAPKPSLGIGGRLPHLVSVQVDECFVVRHDWLLSPGGRPDEALSRRRCDARPRR